MSLKDQVLAVASQQTVPSEGLEPAAVQTQVETLTEDELEVVQGARNSGYGDFYPA